MEINIGIFGSVSVGKSTFINAISGKQYSDSEIKKTTMIPQVYIQSDTKELNPNIIRGINREINNEISKMIDSHEFNISQCQPVSHYIERIDDLFDTRIIDKQLKINIYDIPGLNDSSSKNVYFEWVNQNIHIFDIIIFMTDITRGLNTSDEIEILKLLMGYLTKSKSKMICLINKCDDIHFDHNLNDLVFDEKEQENIYVQANNILADVAKLYGLNTEEGCFTPFLPISSENCFIYRALMNNSSYELDDVHKNRLCKNECGSQQWKKMKQIDKDNLFAKILLNLKDTYNDKILDTGYVGVKFVIQNTIMTNKIFFLQNHMENEIKNLETFTPENVPSYINLINSYQNKFVQLLKLGGKPDYSVFWKIITESVVIYTNYILKLNTKIVRGRDFIDFKDFEKIHSTMNFHCINFSELISSLTKIPECPLEFLKSKEKQIIDKLINIYEQLFSIDVSEQIHINPKNLECYLQLIKNYSNDKFDFFSKKFLEFAANPKCKHAVMYQKELLSLITFILSNCNCNINELYLPFCKIFINKQIWLQYNKSHEHFFPYLCIMKKLLRRTIETMDDKIWSLFDVIYEITEKNISILLGTSSVTNMYKQEIDMVKIEKILNTNDHSSQLDMDFEDKLITLIYNQIIKNK